VTGSVGKTGTKEALRLALDGQGPTHASAGNLNNQWGLPLSLARMPVGVAYGVFELAMNRPGEIAPLARLLRPDVAVITTIEPVHTAFFDTVEQIADAKAEIFAGMPPTGTAVLNRDNRYFARLRDAATAAGLGRIVGFGAHQSADVRLVDCALHATGSAVTASLMGRPIDYQLALAGRHNGRRHRLALADGDAELIDESYNASPTSMLAALRTLAMSRPGPGGRRIAVLGDMLELGRRSGDMHAALAGDIAGLPEGGVALVFTAGTDMARLHAALPAPLRGGHAPDSATLAPLVTAAIRPGDVVMVKGSLGSRMAVVVAALRALDGGDRRPALAANAG
jgi:UDP-N-acetylmuramoyl-tripeptide--D-alanyl-D-alanine ligase